MKPGRATAVLVRRGRGGVRVEPKECLRGRILPYRLVALNRLA